MCALTPDQSCDCGADFLTLTHTRGIKNIFILLAKRPLDSVL